MCQPLQPKTVLSPFVASEMVIAGQTGQVTEPETGVRQVQLDRSTVQSWGYTGTEQRHKHAHLKLLWMTMSATKMY